VNRFNQQEEQLITAARADTIARQGYDISRERFMIGQVDVIELNTAQRERDEARRGYIRALRNFWQMYYNVRELTLYDFKREEPIEEDFDELLL